MIVLLSWISCSQFITKTENFLLVFWMYFILICESLHNLTVQTGNSSWSKIVNLRHTAKTAACSSNLGTVNAASFIEANQDLDITNEQTGLLLSMLMHFEYATAPYVIVDAPQKTCNSMPLLFSLWKPNHLFNNILMMFSQSCVHAFHCTNNWYVVWSHPNLFSFYINLEWFSLVSVMLV